jgi:Ca2+-binding EF-hand superfamily protein
MTIDSEEFRKMMFSLAEEYQLPQPTEKEVKETMIKVDINRDDTIDYDEFKKFVRELFNKLIKNKRKDSA